MPTPFPDPEGAFGSSFGTAPKVRVEFFPQPLLLVAAEFWELPLDTELELVLAPELPIEVDPVLDPEPWRPLEPLLDAVVGLPTELPSELPAPDALPLPWLRELVALPLLDGEVVPLPEALPELEPFEPLPHATAIKARPTGRTNRRRRCGRTGRSKPRY